jgi:hypothetical protein
VEELRDEKEPSVFIKGRDFFDHLSNCQVLVLILRNKEMDRVQINRYQIVKCCCSWRTLHKLDKIK